MERKRLYSLIGAAFGMLLLILDGKTAVGSAQQGIDLCLRTVIPSLFPFFVLSILLTSSLLGASIPVLRPVSALFRIPSGSESILLTGFLGGYPVGAQCVSAAYRSGQLNRSDAQRMLSFCNNAGPAFLFGMIGSMFPHGWMVWLLWAIHIFSAALTALILPGGSENDASVSSSQPVTFTAALRASLSVMATVCGWVVLFRVLIGFLNRWILWLLPVWVRVAVSGLLELSNGCCSLTDVPNVGMRFLLCSGMLAFGGTCVTMQTVSVTGGLSLKQYFTGKLLQTLISLMLATGMQFLFLPDERCVYRFPIMLCSICITLILILFLQKYQKKDSIPATCVV